MIIGNNNSNQGFDSNNRFNSQFNFVKEQNKNNQNNKPINFFKATDPTKTYDVTNRNDMADKSLAMLQERLNNGLISLDEFNRKAKKINQFRQ